MIEFPKDFLWGAATSAYQVEGNNSNCDWWEWEKRVGLKEVSGEACRHYQFYQQDFDIAKELNHNAHRLSVEWSRIEPEEGKFSEQEINHYKAVIAALKERGLEPIVTLHHFTNPLWFAKRGGWHNKKSIDYFLRFVKEIVSALSGKVKYWVTINEPMVYAYHSYILGVWPPQERSIFKANRVISNLISAHIKSYRLIHDIYKTRGLALPAVSIAKNMQAFVPCSASLKNRLAVHLRDTNYNFKFLDAVMAAKAFDFIGVNYYTRSLIDVQGWGIRNLLLDTCSRNHSQLKKNSLGWDIYPEGFYNLLLRLKKYNLPVFILENGISTTDDNLRWDFIVGHLKSLHRAMSEGVNVSAYIHWSLMDNFEWDKGFDPRFGLVEIDYNTYNRKVRESARKLAAVCKDGRF